MTVHQGRSRESIHWAGGNSLVIVPIVVETVNWDTSVMIILLSRAGRDLKYSPNLPACLLFAPQQLYLD